ncbi:MAG: hypothetical protein GY717_08050 [Rhodobacteraceae bacterium]|nr:hypothetical protein [Paracoccaceae bacterium]
MADRRGAATRFARTGFSSHWFLCLCGPQPFWAVGQVYDDFTQTSDPEVMALLSTTALRSGHMRR